MSVEVRGEFDVDTMDGSVIGAEEAPIAALHTTVRYDAAEK